LQVCSNFSEKERRAETFLTPKRLAPQADERDLDALTVQRLGRCCWLGLTEKPRMSDRNIKQKGMGK
jgi:hypothetical protein